MTNRRKVEGSPDRSAWKFSALAHSVVILFLLAESYSLVSLPRFFQENQPNSVTLCAYLAEQSTEEDSWQLSPATESPPDETLPSSLIASQVQNAVVSAQQRSSEENLADLVSKTNQLERLSTQESVADVVQAVNRVLGAKDRATAPVESSEAGVFDFDTAQFHEVRQEIDPKGIVRYTAVLVDAAGRTSLAELSPDEGAQLHQVMTLIKSSPFLESIYRSLIMGLLDELLKSQSHPQ